jgi:hypothetical protein
MRGPTKGDVPSQALLEPAQVLAFTPIPPSRGELTFPKAGQQKHYFLCAEAGGPRQKRLRESVEIVALTYRFARQRFYRRKNPSRGIITARRCKQKTFTRRQTHNR